jgi:simple sugar transport system ATP-binding protein
VHAGEIVGIAGVSGNGQQELLAAISGEARVRDATRSSVRRRRGRLRRAAAAQLGFCFVPEERLGRGAVPRCRSPTTRCSRRTGAASSSAA